MVDIAGVDRQVPLSIIPLAPGVLDPCSSNPGATEPGESQRSFLRSFLHRFPNRVMGKQKNWNYII